MHGGRCTCDITEVESVLCGSFYRLIFVERLSADDGDGSDNSRRRRRRPLEWNVDCSPPLPLSLSPYAISLLTADATSVFVFRSICVECSRIKSLQEYVCPTALDGVRRPVPPGPSPSAGSRVVQSGHSLVPRKFARCQLFTEPTSLVGGRAGEFIVSHLS